ncbi:hypothetical protein [Streptomyces sp. NBC_01439]|uniref:hypothetical protein n=1 Tax=Streptomyces sp. NBC_01439 TaxID=2903867 RepID=UPI002E2C6227|nr:hypothetical protein [Streptomyces sp. NBC_01439]
MNGYQHYQRSEEIAAECARYGVNPETVALAQVHATLALAAATADASNFKRDLYAGNGEELPAVKTAKNRADRAAASAAAFLD